MQVWKNSKIKPDIMAERREGETVELDFCPDESLFQFQGHFPTQPILPGVGQLDWAVQYAKEKLGQGHEVAQISQLKFRELMMPGMSVTLRLEYQADKNCIFFSYFNEEKSFSSGIIKLGRL